MYEFLKQVDFFTELPETDLARLCRSRQEEDGEEEAGKGQTLNHDRDFLNIGEFVLLDYSQIPGAEASLQHRSSAKQ